MGTIPKVGRKTCLVVEALRASGCLIVAQSEPVRLGPPCAKPPERRSRSATRGHPQRGPRLSLRGPRGVGGGAQGGDPATGLSAQGSRTKRDGRLDLEEEGGREGRALHQRQ